MKVKKITLSNFRNFEGTNTINLEINKNNGNNIVLIGGKNGTGKTTIFETIKLCMFGRKFNGTTFSEKQYHNFLRKSRNKNANKKKDSKYYIQLELEIDDQYPHYTLTLKREWDMQRKGKVNEDFTVLRGDNPLEIVPKEYWNDYIQSLIPPHISQYFFFDGEKVKELAIGNNAEEILRQSIKDLIGLNLYERLHDDMQNLEDKIKRRNINEKELVEHIDTKVDERKILNEEMKNYIEKINENNTIISESQADLKKVENELKRKAGAYAKDREENEKKLMTLQMKIDAINEDTKQICSDILPFEIASKLKKDLLKQIKQERQLKDMRANTNMLNMVKKKVIKNLEKNKKLSEIDQDNKVLIKCEINRIFYEVLDKEDKATDNKILHDLTKNDYEKIENFLSKEGTNLKKKLNKLLEKREKHIHEKKNINNKLKAIPKDAYIKEFVSDIIDLKTNIEVFENNNTKLQEEKQELEEKISKIQEEIDQLQSKVVCIEEDNRKIKMAKSIKNVLKDYSDLMIASKTDELGKLITEMYQRLANKDDMVKDIKIDKDTFYPVLYDYEGEIVDKESISEGEKEIYALSILWGLSQISNKKLPLVIDSPLAKLDSTHVENILTRFFPVAGDQIVILSHDREINKEDYKKIESNINMSYTLSFDNKKKIDNGYFGVT